MNFLNRLYNLKVVQGAGPLLPLLALLSTLPYAAIYLLNLWGLPHYQFFPLPLIAVGILAKQRWGAEFRGNLWFRLFRSLLLSAGIGGTFFATIFASPWMGFFGFALCLAGWLAFRQDESSDQSLIYLALPVLLIWQPPWDTIVTGDTILIQTLQLVSARQSSQWLDLLGYIHHQPGTVLEFSGRSFGVAEACSGIQSFFTVLCFGALLVVFLRRGPLHSAFLLASCPIWAILMNTIRITAIPIAFKLTGLDLSHGVQHDLLGYSTMALAILLLLSTDELLIKTLGIMSLGSWIQRMSSASSPDSSIPADGLRGRSKWQAVLLAPSLLLFAAFFGIQVYDIKESWGRDRNVIDFFRDEPVLEMTAGDAPKELAGWPQRNYEQETRSRGNDDLGERSDLWFYDAPFGTAMISFDQMFPGWHELTRCYRNAGWQPVQRVVIDGTEAEGWPMVIVHMTRNNERGFLVFSEVDRAGKLLQPPGEYSYWTILQERLRARLTPSVRGALFSSVAYQIQAFVTTYEPLSDDEQALVLQRFMDARMHLWNVAQKRL
ncbi:MAG: exosortase U [Planctomycetales bacterium]|nr:exosortase U [Planctomycetales bacterium]